jgi:dihydrofolate reductase
MDGKTFSATHIICMKITAIAAAGKNGEIGAENKLLWKNLKDDMKFFTETTKGQCVIMGRKTYESIPRKFRPLPGRTTIVVSRDSDFSSEGVIMAKALHLAFKHAEEELLCDDVYVAGGSSIYELALPKCDRVLLTKVDAEFPNADAFFPDMNAEEWVQEIKMVQAKDERNDYSFQVVEFTRL